MRLEAVVAQLQAKLVFAFRPKAAMAPVASADFLMLGLFLGPNLGMNFDHDKFPRVSNGNSSAIAGD
jgi:hypothetical protein